MSLINLKIIPFVQKDETVLLTSKNKYMFFTRWPFLGISCIIVFPNECFVISLVYDSIEKGLLANEIPAFYAKGIKNLELNDVLLEWENPLFDFFTNGLEIENFENFSLRNFKIHAAFDRQELYDIKISNGKNYKL